MIASLLFLPEVSIKAANSFGEAAFYADRNFQVADALKGVKSSWRGASDRSSYNFSFFRMLLSIFFIIFYNSC